MNEQANQFMLGGIVFACFAIAVFFVRFWRKTSDRLFLCFAIAFGLLGLNWLLLAFIQQDEVRTVLYLLRLLAFVLILAAIVDKNRSRPEANPVSAEQSTSRPHV